MGQKVNPIGIRLGITRDWTSKWYADSRNYPDYVHQDWEVREFLKRKLAEASVSRIAIERAARKSNITIQTARPGVGVPVGVVEVILVLLPVGRAGGPP